MCKRFQDIFSLYIPDWVLNPFDASTSTESLSVQEQLISLQSDFELKSAFSIGGYEKFWIQEKLRVRYPIISEQIKMLSLPSLAVI